jgi:hypothetical protein
VLKWVLLSLFGCVKKSRKMGGACGMYGEQEEHTELRRRTEQIRKASEWSRNMNLAVSVEQYQHVAVREEMGEGTDITSMWSVAAVSMLH